MPLISPLMPVPQCIFILRIKNEQKETLSETVSDSRFVINVDTVSTIASVMECTWTLSVLEALRNPLYKFKIYLLTYIVYLYGITGCAVAQHCYNDDVSFLWEKWKL